MREDYKLKDKLNVLMNMKGAEKVVIVGVKELEERKVSIKENKSEKVSVVEEEKIKEFFI